MPREASVRTKADILMCVHLRIFPTGGRQHRGPGVLPADAFFLVMPTQNPSMLVTGRLSSLPAASVCREMLFVQVLGTMSEVSQGWCQRTAGGGGLVQQAFRTWQSRTVVISEARCDMLADCGDSSETDGRCVTLMTSVSQT